MKTTLPPTAEAGTESEDITQLPRFPISARFVQGVVRPLARNSVGRCRGDRYHRVYDGPDGDTMTWQQRAMDRYYNRGRGWVDGTTEFHAMCAANIPRGGRILEIGPGPGGRTTDLLATLGDVTGLDVDPDARSNPALQAVEIFDGGTFPFSDASFDACVSDYVLEHVASPILHLSEVARVLRPRGAYILRTPNRFHYVTVVSALTPHWFHLRVANPLRGRSKEAHAPYPTFYRMNSRRAMRRAMSAAGLEEIELRLVEKDPSYGMRSPLLFYPFLAYERLVNSSRALEGFRSNIFAVLRKPVDVDEA